MIDKHKVAIIRYVCKLIMPRPYYATRGPKQGYMRKDCIYDKDNEK